MSLLDSILVSRPIPQDSNYQSDMKDISFFNISYDSCGKTYTEGDAPDGPIIYKFECEESDDYKTRKKQTPTRSYVSSILNKYSASVFRNEPARQFNTDIDNLLYSDADGSGTSLNKFMRKALLTAQIEGVSYLMADSTDSNGEIRTIAQAQDAGYRPFIRLIKRESVINVSKVEDVIVEAVVLFVDEYGSKFARYMNDTDYVDILLNDKLTVMNIGSPYPHGYSSIPLVEIKPFSNAQSETISYSQRAIVNTLSLLKQEEAEQTFTRWAISGVQLDDDAIKKLKWGSKRVMFFNTQASINRMGSDKSQSDSLRESIKQEEDAMYYQAGVGRSNVSDSTSNVSGVALLIQREDFFIYCSSLKHAIESAEQKIMDLIYTRENVEYVPVVYSDRFIADDNGAELQKLRDLLSLPLPQTFKNIAIKNYIDTYHNIGDSDMALIEQELSNPTIGE